MQLNKYLEGKGFDVSRRKILASANHAFVEPNNLYTLKKHVMYESADFIYSQGLINETKFFRILIKEWLNFCKTNGYIIIEMSPNRFLNFNELVDEAKLLIGEKGEIVEKEFLLENQRGTLIIQKTKSALEKGDSIDKWSFGILSGGFTDDQIDKSVDSMIEQNVPIFEIIICGNYNGKFKKTKNKNVKLVEFDSTLPWITKKKNVICEHAKYENLMVIHDHLSLDKNWYDGMKKYGNYFEVLSNIIHDPLGRRASDWITYGIPLEYFSKYAFTGAIGNLEYLDWDKDVDIGGFCVMKKSVWKKCPWDERLLLWQAEDMKISGDFYLKGIVPRFNPYAIAYTSKKEWGEHGILYKFNTTRLGKATSKSFKHLLKYYAKSFLYNHFGVYLKRPDAHSENKRTFSVPKLSKH